MELSIVIPAYNEEKRIEPTLREMHEFLRDARVGFEIVVVDDGSSDGTVRLVESLAGELSGLRCIESKPNRGKGYAVRAGMLEARGEVRILCDADGSMPASELSKLVAPVFSGEVEIAIGSRYVAGSSSDKPQPEWRRKWSRIANRLVQRFLVDGIADTQCGYKAFRADAAEALFARATVDGWSFDLEILGMATRAGMHIEEVGIHWTDDENSRVHPVRDFFKVAREFVVIRRRLRKTPALQLGTAPA